MNNWDKYSRDELIKMIKSLKQEISDLKEKVSLNEASQMPIKLGDALQIKWINDSPVKLSDAEILMYAEKYIVAKKLNQINKANQIKDNIINASVNPKQWNDLCHSIEKRILLDKDYWKEIKQNK